jgi:hypothetical protein
MTQGRPMFGPVKGDWQPCPPGELGGLADRLRARRWAGTLLGAGAAVLAAAAVAFSAWQVAVVFGPPAGARNTGCSCDGCDSAPVTPCQPASP